MSKADSQFILKVVVFLDDWLGILAVPFAYLLNRKTGLRQRAHSGRSSQNLSQERTDVLFVKAGSHSSEYTLVRGNGNYCGVSKAKVQTALEVKLVASLEPEESEGLLAVALCDLHHSLEVCIAVDSGRFVDVREERDDADGSALAVLIVRLLIE